MSDYFNDRENGGRTVKEAISIDTSRVYDSCADKDCLSDLRVYFTPPAQNVVDNASSIRSRGCDILNVITDVEEVPFNRGYYSVDMTFFFVVSLDVFTAPSVPPTMVTGLSVFSKKAILYGSEGSVRVFSSEYGRESDGRLPSFSTNPRAKVQVAQPLCLDARMCRPCDCCNNLGDAGGIPSSVTAFFGGEFGRPNASRAVKATIGLFSIVQLERDVQMLIPAYDFCMPEKECSCGTDNPCEAFRKVRFPVAEFFPPQQAGIPDPAESSFVPPCSCAAE